MPSDVVRDITPHEVTPLWGRRGSRYVAGTGQAHDWGIEPREHVMPRGCRVCCQTAMGRGVCWSELKPRRWTGRATEESYDRQPDSGKPIVRDGKRASRKRGLWR